MKRLFTSLIVLCFLGSVELFSQCNTNICAGPPMGQGSLCAEDACILCDPCLLDGYMGATVAGSNTCDVPGPFCGSIENNQWWAFLAPPSGTVTFSFSVTACTGQQNGAGIQAEVYSTDDCNNFTSVSDCWSPGTQTNGNITATNLVPYCTYYVMVDGWANDFCDFTINTADCQVPPPPVPYTINGPTEVCPGAVVSYTLQPEPASGCGNNSNAVLWTGIEPTGTIIGPQDQGTITVQWNQPGATVINATTTNVCFGVNVAIPLPVVIEPIPPGVEEFDVCIGECVTCAGQLVCTPGVTPVVLQSWLGCDSLIQCIVNPITPVFEDLGEITICAPDVLEVCGETFDVCGVGSATCDNWQGCDSTVAFDLAILDPMAVIEPPGVLACGAGANIQLDGSASSVASNCVPNADTEWSWTGPGISGPSNIPFIDVTEPGEYCLTVTHSRGIVSCSDEVCVTVLQDNNVPQTPQISGPLDPCPNSTETYTVTAVGTPAPTGYTWDTGGVPFTDNGTSITVTWPGSGPQQVCVTADNDCGSSSPACITVNVQNGPTATISGGGSICPNSTDEVDLTITLTGSGPWDLTVTNSPSGTTQTINIPSSPFVLTVSDPGTYTLSDLIGGGGCPGTTDGSAVVDEFPTPTADLSGDQSICEGSGDMVCLDVVLTGAAPWTLGWAVDGNPQASLTVNASPYCLSLGEAQAGNITLLSVTDGNGCEGTVGGAGTVTVNSAPTFSNLSTACDATNQFYTVTFTVSGGDQASWSVTPQGANLNTTTGVFVSDPIPSGSTSTFTVTDGNDCNPIEITNTVLCDCDTESGDMDLNLIEECGDGPVNPAVTVNEFLDGNDVLNYILHSGNGVSIVDPVISTSTTTEVSFQAPMQYGVTYYLSAVAGDDDGTGTVDLDDPCLDVSQGTPIVFYEIPTATLSGTPIICEGEVAQMTVDFTGVGPWSITYNDGTSQTINGITDNPFTLEITPATNVTVTLEDMNDVNCPGTVSGNSDVTVNTGVMASATPTCDPSGLFYTVTITISGGDQGSYFVDPPDGSFVDATTWVSDPIDDGLGYIFVVDDANGCTPVTVEQTEVLCDCTTEVGTMDITPIEECGDGPVTANYDDLTQVFDPDDVLGFILHTNSGSTPGTVLAQNDGTSSTFGFAAPMNYGQTYYISAVVGNNDGTGLVDLADGCLATAPGTPVTFFEVPTATLSGDASICQGDSTELTVTFTGQQPWSVSIDGQDIDNIMTPSILVTVMPNTDQTYSITSATDANCPAVIDGTADVQVNEAPEVINLAVECLPDTNIYNVIFEITGGDLATYDVIPVGSGVLAGNIFTSNDLESGASYTYSVDDGNACGPVTITGTQDCDCETDAGTMGLTLAEECVDGIITVDVSLDPFLDQDDALQYYLHSDPTDPLGSVVDISDVPTFNFDGATMTAGQTYYISAVAGNDLGGGVVDITDFCLSISLQNTPVVWHVLPTVTMVVSDPICEGDDAPITFTFTGTGPDYTVMYTVDGTMFSQTTSDNPFVVIVNPDANVDVTVTGINDLSTGCSNVANESGTIEVSQNVSAGTPVEDFEFCEGLGGTIDLNDNLIDQTPGGEWTDPSGNVVPNGIVNANTLAPDQYEYTYTITAAPPCLEASTSLNVIINPGPVADAGIDQELDCDILEVTIGGTNTTPGIAYEWIYNGPGVTDSIVGNAATIDASLAGDYTLVALDLNTGCFSTDEMTVEQNASSPDFSAVASPVECFGDNNGFIFIDSVWNATMPILCSLNGSPFSSDKQFTDLAPGDYTLAIIDANGCEHEKVFTVEEPQEVNVEIVLDTDFGDSIVVLGDSLMMTALTTPSFEELDIATWSPSTLVPCDTCQSVVISPVQQTTFSIMVDENGCRDEDQITIFVKKERPVYIPNAFSPNSDGTNEVFMIYGGDAVVRVRSFLVFSRWGETVFQFFNFEPNNPAFGWDGRHRGTLMNPAVFTYFAEIEFIDGSVELYEGDVNLIR